MPDCQKFTCCGDESYTYEISRAAPNPVPVTLYTLELLIDPAGTGTVTGAGQYAENTFVTITAVPSPGYAFAGWTGDYVGNTDTVQIYMDGNKSITANFALIPYTVSLTANPEGSATLTGGGIYNSGSTAIIEAIPLGYFQFQNWSGDISSINNPEDVVVDNNKSITANMARPVYTVGVVISGGGTVIGAGEYEAGSVISLSAFPDFPWTFAGWSGDVVSTDNPVSVTVDGDKSVVATFDPGDCTTQNLFSGLTVPGTDSGGTTAPGNLSLSSYFASGVLGVYGGNRQWRIMAYNNGNGLQYVSPQPVDIYGTLTTSGLTPPPSGVSGFVPSTSSFQSYYTYADTLMIQVACQNPDGSYTWPPLVNLGE